MHECAMVAAERIYDHYHNMRGFFNMSSSAPVDWCGPFYLHFEIVWLCLLQR